MSNTNNVFTLEALDEEIERKYAPFKFSAGEEDFTLVSLLRVDGKVRKAVMDRMKQLDNSEESDDDFDEEKTVSDLQFVLSSVTKDRKGGRLVKAVGPELLRLMTLLRKWQEATQPGEAQDSPA